MLPHVHAVNGALFAFCTWFLFPEINLIFVLMIFLASVFIDVDHYMLYVLTKKDWSLKNSYNFYKKYDGSNDLMIFHTVEFLIIVTLLGFVWIGFYYILAGMIHHLMLDILEMIKDHTKREFSFMHYYFKKKKNL